MSHSELILLNPDISRLRFLGDHFILTLTVNAHMKARTHCIYKSHDDLRGFVFVGFAMYVL